uniref:Uncharacterized protein n=1 Tax=Physcomitrium patens TaxID=3218 RepID=A0A7I4CWN2_PHYPA
MKNSAVTDGFLNPVEGGTQRPETATDSGWGCKPQEELLDLSASLVFFVVCCFFRLWFSDTKLDLPLHRSLFKRVGFRRVLFQQNHLTSKSFN